MIKYLQNLDLQELGKFVVDKKNIDGVLLLNKPLLISSNQALQKVKRIFKAKKAGHTGTLDPLATGLLPICFGEATKFANFLLDANKEYVATIKLGEATTTYDREGEITHKRPFNGNISVIQNCIKDFLGKIKQTPPIYSALKVNGKALYEYARSNEEVEIKSREVEIYEIEILEWLNLTNTLVLRVLCSKGTYIRSLANDIGEKLGCGAHLIGLIRTKTNQFGLNQALSFNELENLGQTDLYSKLLPMDILVKHLASISITEEIFNNKVKYGHSFPYIGNYINGELVSIYYKNLFLGITRFYEGQFNIVRLIDLTKITAGLSKA